MKYIEITTDCEIIAHDIDDQQVKLEDLQAICDGCIDVVNMNKDIDMIVNDEGTINGSDINVIASGIANQPIFGNVAIVRVVFGEDGGEWYGMPDNVVDTWIGNIATMLWGKKNGSL